MHTNTNSLRLKHTIFEQITRYKLDFFYILMFVGPQESFINNENTKFVTFYRMLINVNIQMF